MSGDMAIQLHCTHEALAEVMALCTRQVSPYDGQAYILWIEEERLCA